ncbi:MAG: amidohydrolase [Phycisphaeraceae bacterium]|nr:amidohydrolase [Phycisphaeraceae bacterium]MBX3368169.1 amidohydrolase [Phycisphaeraceae bacterium]QYK47842.1 MAG: amidohydrolase [Phycisphaeraceae bacterium]
MSTTSTASGIGSTSLTTETLRQMIRRELPELTAIRHDLHTHPEVGFEERRTSQVVQRELSKLGIAFKANVGGPEPGTGTGVIGVIPRAGTAALESGATKNEAIGLRADMDALPIFEETGKPYASKSPGTMHACGHDGHTTILLGAARVLSKLHDRPRTVRLVFQPAEEGGAGGEKMCRDGAIDGAIEGAGPAGVEPISRMFGLHGWPQMPVGAISTRPGPLLASTDDFEATIEGVQAHGAFPHLGADSILAAAQAIVSLQQIVSRNVSPFEPVVVTTGQVRAGSANNVIPRVAIFSGTVRTLTREMREKCRGRLIEIIETTARAYGCAARVRWTEGYPATVNDASLAARVLEMARGAFGAERVSVTPSPTMGGEDFAYYGQHVPTCFYLLGLCPPGADPLRVPQLHQATFDFNDEAIEAGVEMMVRLALEG